jgi:hypothetical protein
MQGVWEIYGKITDSYTNEFLAGAASYQAGAALQCLFAGMPITIVDNLMSPSMYVSGGVSYIIWRGLINLVYGPTIAPALLLTAAGAYGQAYLMSSYSALFASSLLSK